MAPAQAPTPAETPIRLEYLGAPAVKEYPLKRRSFAGSLGVHLCIIALLGLISSSSDPKPIYNEFVKDHKIFIYDFRKPTPVAPAEKSAPVAPRAVRRAPRTFIANAPKPKSVKQMIFVPAPKIELPKDIPAPDLVARMATSLPMVSPPPVAPKPVLKTFSPPRINQSPKLPIRQAPLDLLAPSITLRPPTGPVETDDISSLARLAPPKPNAPPVPTSQPGSATKDVVIANLDPVKGIKELPEGSRPGEFSKGPNLGAPATGGVPGAGVAVPNLTIGNEPEVKKPAAQPDKRDVKTVMYAERLRGIPLSTLSVPLRPATRSIPPTMEARFRGRNVYTIVIPIENIQAYTSDWIVWFAEHDPKSTDSASIYAPLPLRKLEALEEPGATHVKQRVQMAATVSKEGKLTGVTVLSNPPPAVAQAAMQDLTSWEFKPATRAGAPIEVDIVLEIPFNLAPQP